MRDLGMHLGTSNQAQSRRAERFDTKPCYVLPSHGYLPACVGKLHL